MLHRVKSEHRSTYKGNYSVVMVELRDKEAHLNTVGGVNLFPDVCRGAGGSAVNDKQVHSLVHSDTDLYWDALCRSVQLDETETGAQCYTVLVHLCSTYKLVTPYMHGQLL